MKKYKSNYLFTLIFQISNIFLSFFPGLCIMWIFLHPNASGESWQIFPLYLIFILLFVVLGNAIHLLICLFTKHNVYIDEETITVTGRKRLTQKMNLKDVKHVVFDHGMIARVNVKPCSIALFDASYSNYVNIENPSFLMICELQKKLKNVKFKFNNYRWYISWCCIVTAICTIISVISLF